MGVRDSSRASRSGGGTRITVSLIGEGLGVVCGSSTGAPGRGVVLIVPVGEGSAMVVRADERDSSVAWRRAICSSLLSTCS